MQTLALSWSAPSIFSTGYHSRQEPVHDVVQHSAICRDHKGWGLALKSHPKTTAARYAGQYWLGTEKPKNVTQNVCAKIL